MCSSTRAGTEDDPSTYGVQPHAKRGSSARRRKIRRMKRKASVCPKIGTAKGQDPDRHRATRYPLTDR
jgi:hypothetical protein